MKVWLYFQQDILKTYTFDKDSICRKLLINALVYKDSQGVNKNEINNIDKLNKLYYRFGLLKDEISNSTYI